MSLRVRVFLVAILVLELGRLGVVAQPGTGSLPAWTQATARPYDRADPSAAYDASRGVPFMFGGNSGDGVGSRDPQPRVP